MREFETKNMNIGGSRMQTVQVNLIQLEWPVLACCDFSCDFLLLMNVNECRMSYECSDVRMFITSRLCV